MVVVGFIVVVVVGFGVVVVLTVVVVVVAEPLHTPFAWSHPLGHG